MSLELKYRLKWLEIYLYRVFVSGLQMKKWKKN